MKAQRIVNYLNNVRAAPPSRQARDRMILPIIRISHRTLKKNNPSEMHERKKCQR